MDTFTPEQRHNCMAAVHSRDTKPELIVRKFLFSQGFRYRLNSSKLPGHPDIVLRKYKTVIFVNGCFWHGHEGCKYFKMPHSNIDFWTAKILRNQERDKRTLKELTELGWRCITVWECQLKTKVREQTLHDLSITLRNDNMKLNIHPYEMQEIKAGLAAEPEYEYGLKQEDYE
ncbi:MAG: very short patch repair endonuclease [Prevotellaceae bacterium]|nr:very short patch repair endonuclease [Prevotellaceae bacterium]